MTRTRRTPAPPDTSSPAADRPFLTTRQRALLDRLADGQTLREAAAAQFVSSRTADRDIALARKALGVRTTRQVVLVYRCLRN